MAVDITQLGLKYVLVCFKNYMGESLFLLLFAAAILYLIFEKRKNYRALWGLYLGILALTIYNVILIRPFIEKLGFNSEYYRFFWLLPVAALVPYVAARLVISQKSKRAKGIVFGLLAALLVFSGIKAPAWSKEFPVATNLYHVPDDLIEACAIIRRDAGEEQVDRPGVVYDYELNFLATQYDPSLPSVIPYELMLDVTERSRTTDNTDNVWLNSRIAVTELIMKDKYMDHEQFMLALNNAGVHYIIYNIDSPLHEYLLGAGCYVIGETENYKVYKYGWAFS